MVLVNISIRGVDAKLFKEFKANAAKDGTGMGTALNVAISNWLASKKAKKKTNFLDLEPWDWGAGNKKASSEIDDELYGGEKPA